MERGEAVARRGGVRHGETAVELDRTRRARAPRNGPCNGTVTQMFHRLGHVVGQRGGSTWWVNMVGQRGGSRGGSRWWVTWWVNMVGQRGGSRGGSGGAWQAGSVAHNPVPRQACVSLTTDDQYEQSSPIMTNLTTDDQS
jgi:hypothetical protein